MPFDPVILYLVGITRILNTNSYFTRESFMALLWLPSPQSYLCWLKRSRYCTAHISTTRTQIVLRLPFFLASMLFVPINGPIGLFSGEKTDKTRRQRAVGTRWFELSTKTEDQRRANIVGNYLSLKFCWGKWGLSCLGKRPFVGTAWAIRNQNY